MNPEILITRSLEMNFKDFYEFLIRAFIKEDGFFNLDLKNDQFLPSKVKQFKGVFVILDKNFRLIGATSHGKFSRESNGEIKNFFTPFNPITSRFTPIYVDDKYHKIGLNLSYKETIKACFGIDLMKGKIYPKPEHKVKDLLSSKIPKNEVFNLPPTELRKLIKNKLQKKHIQQCYNHWNMIFTEIFDMDDLKFNFFYINENATFTPNLLKEILLHAYNSSDG